jgi:hypothetical protein
MERAGSVANIMTAAQVARAVRTWGSMVTAPNNKTPRKNTQAGECGREMGTELGIASDMELRTETATEIEATDDEWTPPTREALQRRLDRLSAAALRTAAELEAVNVCHLLRGWVALAAPRADGSPGLALDPAAVRAVTAAVPRVAQDIHWQGTGGGDAADLAHDSV